MALSPALCDREQAKFRESSDGLTTVAVDSPTSLLNGAIWDYTAQTLTATTDTWTFRDGGSGGTITAVIVITYTNASKNTIDNVERTT